MTQTSSPTNSSVQIIQGTPNSTAGQEKQKKRVAVYCRVSTDFDAQQSSLEAQTRGFSKTIESHDDWQLVGIYADKGISGTKASNRAEFMKMIAKCEAGGIDVILTKSISRFARNTLDCLQYVRRLKELGVSVYFEKENIDSRSAVSEALLSILAAIAQEESFNLSENLKWSYRKRFQNGQPHWSKLYGYCKIGDNEHVIVEEEAHVVRLIFEWYSKGYTLIQIANRLDRLPISARAGKKWYATTLRNMLSNERYCGDVHMQKYYTASHLSHRPVRNDSSVIPSYYMRNHHQAIVDRELFDIVRAIRLMRDTHYGSEQYPYYGTLICPDCGEKMVRFIPPFKRRGAAWTCGKCQPRPLLRERYIDKAVREAIARMDVDILALQASSEDESVSRAAARALKWKDQIDKCERIEYILVYELFESITFVDWRSASFAWKCGLESAVEIEYERLSDVPIISASDGESIEGHARRAVNNRAEYMNALSIEQPEGAPRPYVYSSSRKASKNDRI